MAPRARTSILDIPAQNGHAPDDETLLQPEGARALKQRSRAGIPVYLPGSGSTVLARRPSLMAMSIKAGYVPNPISEAVLRWIAVNDDVLEKRDEDEQIDDYRNNAAVYVQIAQLCLVRPRLITDRAVDDDSDDEINPGDLADRDYVFLVNRFVEGEAAELATFQRARGARTAPSAR